MARGGGSPGAPRLDVVPAPFLALLLEFGVHPAALGVRELHDTQLVAWEGAAQRLVRGPATAHVERSALERALTEQVGRSPWIGTVAGDGFPPSDPARLVLDATGRRAASALRRVGPPEPWVARGFWSPVQPTAGDPPANPFRLAALPYGYAYGLGNAMGTMLGVVGPRRVVAGAPDRIEALIVGAGAGWLLEGLPALRTLEPGRGGVASVQWGEGGVMPRVGDAGLARDALASQGLANGVSGALDSSRGGSGAIGRGDRWRSVRGT